MKTSRFTQKDISNATLAKKQVELEFMMRSVGIERFHANDNRTVDNSQSQTSYYSRIVSATVEQLSDTIQAFFDHYEGKKGRRPTYLNLLKQVPVKTSALIALRTVIDLIGAKDMHISNMMVRVGSRIEDQVKFAGLEDFAPKYMEAIQKSLDSKGTKSYSHAKRTFDAAVKNSGYQHKAWDKEDVTQLGAFLIDLVGQVEFEGAPLLTKVVVDSGLSGAHSEVKLVPSEHVLEWIEAFQQENEILSPAYAPCVVKPRNWTSPFNGGFHVEAIAETMSLVRGKKRHVEGLTFETMPKVYEAINALQSVGWSISEDVLNTLDEVLECKLPLGIPQQEPYECRPSPVPAHLRTLHGAALLEAMTSEEQEEFFAWKADAADVVTQNKLRVSELVQVGRIRNEAARYNKFNEFFFVYSLDYRSRVYVESSLITPQGGDLQKGLIRFSEGKALGLKGKYWLAVQGAGVWAAKDEKGIALDKKPFCERVATVLSDEFTEMVRAITEDPINCTLWCDADKPWQFLNWCFEWADLLDWMESGKSDIEFISHLPIAMDGSCSGTQHYSMILKDEVSGALVNLTRQERPQDIYGATAELFKKKLSVIMDSEEAELNEQLMATEWMLHANRNLCKPPVMTLVYGSSQMTCRKTTGQYLYDVQAKEDKAARASGRDSKKKHNFESNSDAAGFASPLIWEAVSHVQRSAKVGMKFIKQVATFCCKNGINMQWRTQTGFVVTQEIFQTKAKRVNTVMFGNTKVTLREETNELDANKMRSSSAPNFIHSMDASHLLLTVWSILVKHGLSSMAVIHDSFGVHACDTELLRKVLLEELVDMYTNVNVLEELVVYNEDRVMKCADLELPELGNLDYDEVLEAAYAFG